jgi:hypothetical protein
MPEKDPLVIYGIKIGENVQIHVTIHSRPAPKIEWTDYDKLAGRFTSPGVIPLVSFDIFRNGNVVLDKYFT